MKPSIVAACLLICLGPYRQEARSQVPAGTVFTYQGRLTESGGPATGVYDIDFKLFNDATAGTQVGSTLVADNWPVENGLFSVQLDFGAGVFTGNATWLQIAVRPGSSTGAYTTLLPRQAITATPYALYALSGPNSGDITSVSAGTGLTGGGTSGDVTIAASFSGTGSAATVARSDHNHDATYVNVSEINSITSAMIVNGTITATDLLDGACLAEIADDDGAGSGLDADLLDGQHASGFAAAAHNHDATYFTEAEATAMVVDAAGDVMTGPLSITTGQTPGLSSSSSNSVARAVYGSATNTSSLLNTYGGYFEAASRYGTGVYGQSAGINGKGVHGEAAGTGAVTNYGGYFSAAGDSGRGIYAEASSAAGTNYGGYFTAEGATAHAVHAQVSAGAANAVYGETTNAGGTGVYPTAGYFKTTGTNGRPVYGRAEGDGDTRAIYGHATNTGAVTNYAGFFRSAGQTGMGVYAEATNTTAGVTNYGGYFKSAGPDGRGVYAESTGSDSTAGHFVSAGNLGVYAETTNAGVTDNASAGYFVSNGGNGTGVTGQATGATGEGVYGYVSQSGAKAVRGENFYSHQIGWLGGGDYAVKAQGDLVVTGAHRGTIGPNGGAPFPRPAYDSGWQSIALCQELMLTHNIGGDTGNYVVDLQGKTSTGNVGNAGLGMFLGDYGYEGIFYSLLPGNNTQIRITRMCDDFTSSQIRVRIWVIN